MTRDIILKDMYVEAAKHMHKEGVHDKGSTFMRFFDKNVPHLVELLRIHHVYFIEFMTLAIRQVAEYYRIVGGEQGESIRQKTSNEAEADVTMLKTALGGDGGEYAETDIEFSWADDALPKIDLDNLLAHDIGKPVCFDATILGLDEHQGVPYKYLVRYTDDGCLKYGKSETSEDLILEYQYDKEYHIILEEHMTDLRYSVMEQDDGVYSRKDKRRVNGKLYTGRLVNLFERADKARVIGMLQKAKGKKRGKEKNEHDLYVRVVDASRRTISEDETLTADELEMFKEDAKDPDSFYRKLTQSLAPHIYGMTLAKGAGLLAISGSYGLGDSSRDQLMVYIVGNPGVGKSQIGRALSELKRSRSFYANFQQATARGMTFGQEEFDGRKILRAGVCVLFNYVILNEFDKGTRHMRDDISDIMSDELATYNRVPFNVSQHVDCTIIALGNPKARVWKHDLSLFKNLMPIEAQMLDRLWIIRAKEEDAKERRKHASACRQGIYTPPYTMRQLAGWILYRSNAEPKDNGGESILEDFFESFDTLRADDEIELKFDARQETDVVRNCRALARLLGFNTVDRKCARMAIEIYTESLRSLRIDVDAGDYSKSGKLVTDKNSMIVCFDQIVEELKDKDGYFQREAVVQLLYSRFNHWKSENEAGRYFDKLADGREQYIVSDRNGWCLVN